LKQTIVTASGTKTFRKDLKALLNKGINKQNDLEPIKESEEDAGGIQGMVNSISRQQIDIEESYSFSLRNYPSHKNVPGNENRLRSKKHSE